MPTATFPTTPPSPQPLIVTPPVSPPSPIVTPPTSINGVSLVTRAGRPRSRYSMADRLRIMGATMEDLLWYEKIFCPGSPAYARTKSGSHDPRSWWTSPHRLTRDLVAKHLVGNLTGLPPVWVAARGWSVTRWLAIDVDYRAKGRDFTNRCQFVRDLLTRVFRVPWRGILECPTPSGGRHYYIFFNQCVRTDALPAVLAKVGLQECPGRFEIFPRRNKALRLMGGFIPGDTYDAGRWLRVVRMFQQGEFPLVSWTDFANAADEHRQSVRKPVGTPRPVAAPAPVARPQAIVPFGVPRSRLHRAARGLREAAHAHSRRVARDTTGPGAETPSTTAEVAIPPRYEELIDRPIKSVDEAAELWNLGVCMPGTRVVATKRMAYHLVVAKGLSGDEATDMLVEWVYRTGRQTSVDVMADLAAGTSKVEEQTRAIVTWTVDHVQRKDVGTRDRSHLSREEIEAVVASTGRAAARTITEVALCLLRYAKLHGQPTPDGWVVMVSAGRVIRRWPGCRGKGSRRMMEELQSTGLVKLVRQKVQSTNRKGRPRTYLIKVRPDLRKHANLSHAEAMALAEAVRSGHDRTPGEAMQCSRALPDTYRESETLNLRGEEDSENTPQPEPTVEPKAVEDFSTTETKVFARYMGEPRESRRRRQAAEIDFASPLAAPLPVQPVAPAIPLPTTESAINEAQAAKQGDDHAHTAEHRHSPGGTTTALGEGRCRGVGVRSTPHERRGIADADSALPAEVAGRGPPAHAGGGTVLRGGTAWNRFRDSS